VTAETALLRLVLALALGAVIGIERQWNHHAAGLKTNALVALGAAVFGVLGASAGGDAVSRIGAQIVSGIGFLAGGVILRQGLTVVGLNTAATLWCTAGVGTLAGVGAALYAAIAGALVVAANLGLRPVADMVSRAAARRASGPTNYTLIVTAERANERRIRKYVFDEVARHGAVLRGVDIDTVPAEDKVQLTVSLHFSARDDAEIERIVGGLSALSGVRAVRWIAEPSAE
jgi:putative Mg2+ transporter-C (MgtC) family protein